LGLGMEQAANFIFLVFLFAVIASLLLALLNYKGLGNVSLLEIRVGRRQIVAYLILICMAVAVFAAVRAALPEPGPVIPTSPLRLQISGSRAMFIKSDLGTCVSPGARVGA